MISPWFPFLSSWFLRHLFFYSLLSLEVGLVNVCRVNCKEGQSISGDVNRQAIVYQLAYSKHYVRNDHALIGTQFCRQEQTSALSASVTVQ
jgi:hypothetical protein